jgi:hypothetical protein
MRITTENIEEWCFRYLEKDLSINEIAFFEKELQLNIDLSVELNKWKKTFLINEEILPNTNLVEQSLYRFKHQIALLLTESILVIGICAAVFLNEVNVVSVPKISDKPAVIIESTSAPKPMESNTTTQTITSNKQPTSIQTKNNTVNINNTQIEEINENLDLSESITQLDSIITPTAPEKVADAVTPKDSILIVKKQSTPTKKSYTKRKYSTGSRIIPLNNDL